VFLFCGVEFFCLFFFVIATATPEMCTWSIGGSVRGVEETVLDDWVSSRKAATMNEFRMLCGQLLATEGERRRGRLEIQRPGQEGPSKGDSVVAEYRAKLGVVS